MRQVHASGRRGALHGECRPSRDPGLSAPRPAGDGAPLPLAPAATPTSGACASTSVMPSSRRCAGSRSQASATRGGRPGRPDAIEPDWSRPEEDEESPSRLSRRPQSARLRAPVGLLERAERVLGRVPPPPGHVSGVAHGPVRTGQGGRHGRELRRPGCGGDTIGGSRSLWYGGVGS